MSFADYVASVESPTGEDNRMGSGAFGRFQFMPATAAELARTLPWGTGATPETVKSLVAAVPGRDKELYDLYEGNSRKALASAGLPVDKGSILAMHRFGQAGGRSVLQADPNMPVADWVNSVQWGASPDAVIKQNGLDKFATVGDLRRGFLGMNEPAAPAPAAAPPPPVAVAPVAGPQPLDPMAAMSLAQMFTPQAPQQRKKPRGMLG